MKQTFQYDRFGNRRFDAANTTTLGSCPQTICNPLINTSDNRFSAGQGYSYDKTGNVTVDANGNQFLYDAENHQKEVKNAQNQTIGQYLYDGEGRRVKKISNLETVIFVYDGGGQLAAEYSTQTVQTPQTSYLTTDHLGSPRVITNQLGAVTSRKDFAAFGDETITAQRTQGLGYKPDEIRQDYTGYQKDDESGLEYAQARYYNTSHGRFTSVDPLTASATIKNPQTFNRYSYVTNSPYKFVDPLGLQLSDIGIYQTTNPYYAYRAENISLRNTQNEIRQPPRHEAEHNAENAASDSQQHPEETEPPPSPGNAEQSSETTGKMTVILAIAESGTGEHNLGSNLRRAAETRAAELEASGFAVIYAPITTIEGFQGVLDTASNTYYPTIGIEYFGHGSWDAVYIGNGTASNTNIDMNNVTTLKNTSKTLEYVWLNACFTGAQSNGIAAKLAKQLGVPVTEATSGTIFSNSPGKIISRGKHPNTGPTYLINDGGKWITFRP